MAKPKPAPATKPQEMFVVTIGYRHYAVPVSVAPRLLADLAKLREVESPTFRGPWHLKEDGEPAMGEAVLGKVVPAPAPRRDPDLLRLTHQPLAIGHDRD